MVVEYLPYIMGIIIGTIFTFFGVVPDFIFALLTILIEVLGLGVYVVLYFVYNMILDGESAYPNLVKKIKQDTKGKPLYFECLTAFFLVIILPIIFTVSQYSVGSYLWITVVVTHGYLLWEFVYYFTTSYHVEIKSFE